MFNKNAFRAKVVAKGKTLGGLATDIGVNPATLTRKMNGESDFTRSEIHHIRMILSLSAEEADAIFFERELAET